MVFVFVASCGACRNCARGRPNVCQRWPEMRARGELLTGGRRLEPQRPVHRPLFRHLVLCRVCGRGPLLAGEDRSLGAAGRCGHVRLRRADGGRRGSQHGGRAAGRRGGGHRPRRRRPELHAGRAHGRRSAHHRRRSVRREARAGAAAGRHRHLQRRRSRLRRRDPRLRPAAASTTPSRWPARSRRWRWACRHPRPRRLGGQRRPVAGRQPLPSITRAWSATRSRSAAATWARACRSAIVPIFIELYKQGRLPIDRLKSGTLPLEDINAGLRSPGRRRRRPPDRDVQVGLGRPAGRHVAEERSPVLLLHVDTRGAHGRAVVSVEDCAAMGRRTCAIGFPRRWRPVSCGLGLALQALRRSRSRASRRSPRRRSTRAASSASSTRSNAEGKGVIQINYIGGPKAMPPFEVGNALQGRRGRHRQRHGRVLHQRDSRGRTPGSSPSGRWRSCARTAASTTWPSSTTRR